MLAYAGVRRTRRGSVLPVSLAAQEARDAAVLATARGRAEAGVGVVAVERGAADGAALSLGAPARSSLVALGRWALESREATVAMSVLAHEPERWEAVLRRLVD